MLRRFIFGLGLLILSATLLLIHTSDAQAGVQTGTRNIPAMQATLVPPLASIPDDARLLELNKPLTDSMDDSEKSAVRYYKFPAKAGERYHVVITVQSGNFGTNATIASTDFLQVLATTEGDTLINSSLHFAIPLDETYGVVVEYVAATVGTPAPGTISVMLTQDAAK